MSMGSFRSVFMVASCASAALGCYLVSLRVASERAALEQVETEIVLAQRDIRLLQTEIGTRGRLAQLERWNVKVLNLSAPSADQFLNGGFELARMVAPKKPEVIAAPVVLAAAPDAKPAPQMDRPRISDSDDRDLSARSLMQTTSLKREVPTTAPQIEKPRKPAAPKIEAPAAKVEAKPVIAKPRGDANVTPKPDAKTAASKVAAAKPASGPAAKGAATTTAKPVVKAKPAATKSATAKKADPLAPLPAKAVKTAAATPKTAKAKTANP